MQIIIKDAFSWTLKETVEGQNDKTLQSTFIVGFTKPLLQNQLHFKRATTVYKTIYLMLGKSVN